MSGITSGVGLVSGLDIQSIVDKLIAIDAQPRDRLLTRIKSLDAQRTAFLDVSARITALLARVTQLTKTATFQGVQTASSDANVLTAAISQTSATARPGSYSFIVRALATTHQLVSGGFADRAAPLQTGTLTLESAAARADRKTRLETLNGGAGVQRGAFQLTDAAGKTATISITDALTLDDVAGRVNQAGLNITAAIREDALVLTETTGGALRVRESGSGHTAADLGFGDGRTSGTGTLTGRVLSYLTQNSALGTLGDGLGVRRAAGGGDFSIEAGDGTAFTVDLSAILKDDTRLERLNHGNGARLGRIRVTNRQGKTAEIDLTAAKTIGDVRTALQNADLGLTVTLADNRLIVSDTTSGGSAGGTPLKIEDLNGGTMARDLGIAGSSDTGKIDGKGLLFVDSVRDVLNAVNYAAGNVAADGSPKVVASLAADGQRLALTDNTGGTTNPLTLTAIGESKALVDLGFQPGEARGGNAITGRRVSGGVDTVLLNTLNGGQGLQGGVLRIEANGHSADVDVSNAETLQDVMDAINLQSQTANLGIQAGLDANGARLLITNTDGGAAPITISDVSGNFAAATGLVQSSGRILGSNLQRQYVSETTRLTDLNAGRGVALGKFKVTDSAGKSAVIDLSSGATTLADVLEKINDAGLKVRATINETGDGLLLTNTDGSAATFKVEESGGTAARELNLLGESKNGRIDGAYEFQMEIGATDTLDTLANRINAETTLANASLFNDGTAAPWRLTLAARTTGEAGELLLNWLPAGGGNGGSGNSGFDFSTLSRAQDARVILGDNPDGGFLITSQRNTLTDVVPGVTLNLTGTSDKPVTVNITRDLEKLTALFSGFVNDFNAALNRIDDLDSYNPDTQQAGLLLGDGALQAAESRLFRMVSGSVPGASGVITRLSQLGVKLDNGSRLAFDEQKFRSAFEANPEEVIRFFTTAQTGLGNVMKERIEGLTDASKGLLTKRENSLEDQKDQLNGRVTQLNELLDLKRARLLRQFQAMEQALSNLQAQQSALGSLSSMAASAGSLFKSGSSSG